MRVAAAFVTVIMIWSTTPLTVQWSTEVGPLLGLFSRMVISLTLCLLWMRWTGKAMSWSRDAMKVYASAGLGLYAAMSLVYVAAQWLPSGWISVIFGLTPMITGGLAWLWLSEAFTVTMFAGSLLGVLGLFLIFISGASIQAGHGISAQLTGILLLSLSVCIHALSAIGVKKWSRELTGLSATTGGLMVAVPLYALTWLLLEGRVPEQITLKAVFSIMYLGVIGSVVGFVLYFYLIQRVAVSKVSLITLVTPVFALLIGFAINGEPLPWQVMAGCVAITLGLVLFQWGDRLLGTLVVRGKKPAGEVVEKDGVIC